MSGDDRSPNQGGLVLTWEDMGTGAPTVIALAKVCSEALSRGAHGDEELSGEAQAILWCSRQRGVIAVKGNNHAFDSIDRRLAVHVEVDADSVIAFKSKPDPTLAIRFLDGLRELCAAGLVMHQIFSEFSLSRAGFERASHIDSEHVAAYVDQGSHLGRHEW